MTIVDLIILIFIVLCIIVGFNRGFIKESVSVIGNILMICAIIYNIVKLLKK